MNPLTTRLWSRLFAILLAGQIVVAGCTPKAGVPANPSQNSSPPVSPSNSNVTVPTPEPLPEMSSVQLYTYKVVNTFPHDPEAFTEGLVFKDGVLYESTGLNGQSSIRKVDLKTGTVLQKRDLSPDLFGEGIALYGDSIVQLTWKNGKGFVYDKTTFQPQGNFSIPEEGWGITSDRKNLIMSDGTATLHILSPQTYEDMGEIQVSDNGTPVTNLNELEFIDGLIYANVWTTDSIAIIDPGSGRVNGWVNLSGLLPPQSKPVDVLNGIAFDSATGRIFVTGKLWPSLFEIKLVRTN